MDDILYIKIEKIELMECDVSGKRIGSRDAFNSLVGDNSKLDEQTDIFVECGGGRGHI